MNVGLPVEVHSESDRKGESPAYAWLTALLTIMARGNFAAGLGTQLDVLQAAADVTRTRTTRLSAIYLHNVALARLTHACASSAEELNFRPDFKDVKKETPNAAHAADVAKPPQKMSQR